MCETVTVESYAHYVL